ncbi:MAG: CAAD domain-containing protein [Microcoleaceae cyanobacterium]
MTDSSKPKRTAPKGFGASSSKPEPETPEIETPEDGSAFEVELDSTPTQSEIPQTEAPAVQFIQPDPQPAEDEAAQPWEEQVQAVALQLGVDHPVEVQSLESGVEFSTVTREEPVEALSYDAYPTEIQSADFSSKSVESESVESESVEPESVEPALELSSVVPSELSESNTTPTAEPVVKSEPNSPKIAEPVLKSEPIAARAPEPMAEPALSASPVVNVKMEPPMSLESSQKELEKGLDSIKDDLESAKDELETVKDKVARFLADLPENVGNFFNEYQRPLITVGLLLALLITLRVLIGLVNVLNGIPLVKPTFQAIGLGYSGWFIYRYLLRSETRQELSQKWQSFKDDVVGQSQSL